MLALNIRQDSVSAHIALTGAGRKRRTAINSSKAIRILTSNCRKFALKKPLVDCQKLFLKTTNL